MCFHRNLFSVYYVWIQHGRADALPEVFSSYFTGEVLLHHHAGYGGSPCGAKAGVFYHHCYCDLGVVNRRKSDEDSVVSTSTVLHGARFAGRGDTVRQGVVSAGAIGHYPSHTLLHYGEIALLNSRLMAVREEGITLTEVGRDEKALIGNSSRHITELKRGNEHLALPDGV